MSKENNIIKLFISFFKIGLFTFGGGFAMVPMIEKEVMEKHGWINEKELLDIFAISQVTPGVIAVNTATYIGYKIDKFWGSFFATLGVVLPSFIIICAISMFLKNFMEITVIKYAFQGIRMCVILLMVSVVIRLIKADKVSLFYFIMLGISFIVTSFTDFDIIIMLIIAAGVGIFYALLTKKKGENKK